MNWDQIEGNWQQVKGRFKEAWGKLSNDELNEIEGQRDRLEGKLQLLYGLPKEAAHQEVDEFVEGIG